MKYIRKIYTICWKTCFNLLIFSIFIPKLYAQELQQFTEIHLLDTVAYAYYYTEKDVDCRYPSFNLFDANYKTCWVAGKVGQKENPVLYIRLPQLDTVKLHLFNGYGKSNQLYKDNARASKLKLTVYAAFNPEAHLSENYVLYKAIPYPLNKEITLLDSCTLTSYTLPFLKNDMEDFQKTASQVFREKYTAVVADSCLILRLEITDCYKGLKYNDICVSELFFNDCILRPKSIKSVKTTKVYISEKEDAVMVDDDNGKGKIIILDKNFVYQLVDVDIDNQWATVIKMPSEVGKGRAETHYILIDLLNKKEANTMLAECLTDYFLGTFIWLEKGSRGCAVLNYATSSTKSIKLR